MPLLANLLSSLLGSLIGGLGKDAARKAGVLIAALASFAAATTALMVVFRTAVQPLALNMFRTEYGQFMGLAFPPISGDCMATIATVWIACAVYRAHVRITQAASAG